MNTCPRQSLLVPTLCVGMHTGISTSTTNQDSQQIRTYKNTVSWTESSKPNIQPFALPNKLLIPLTPTLYPT